MCIVWCKIMGSPWWPALAFDSHEDITALNLDPPEDLCSTLMPDEIIVIFLKSYDFQKGNASDRNFVRRYSDITPTEALQNARKGKYSQRQQLAEAIKVAEALTKVDAGPRLRAWGASGGVESNSPDGSAEGWFRESWATSERSRERFSITGPRADETERFLAYLSTTLPASSPQASELADAPKATRPPAVPTQAKGPKMAHPPAWYQPLEALSSDFCSLGRVRRLIEEALSHVVGSEEGRIIERELKGCLADLEAGASVNMARCRALVCLEDHSKEPRMTDGTRALFVKLFVSRGQTLHHSSPRVPTRGSSLGSSWGGAATESRHKLLGRPALTGSFERRARTCGGREYPMESTQAAAGEGRTAEAATPAAEGVSAPHGQKAAQSSLKRRRQFVEMRHGLSSSSSKNSGDGANCGSSCRDDQCAVSKISRVPKAREAGSSLGAQAEKKCKKRALGAEPKRPEKNAAPAGPLTEQQPTGEEQNRLDLTQASKLLNEHWLRPRASFGAGVGLEACTESLPAGSWIDLRSQIRTSREAFSSPFLRACECCPGGRFQALDQYRVCLGSWPVWDDGYFTDASEDPEASSLQGKGEDLRTRGVRRQRVSSRTPCRLLDRDLESLDPHIMCKPALYRDPGTALESRLGMRDPEDLAVQPFRVAVHPEAALICDFHAHLADSEIIGLLGGYWDRDNRVIYVQAPFPCRSTDRDDDGATDVEVRGTISFCGGA